MKNKKTDTSKKEYEQLGKSIASIYESGYVDTGKSLRTSFLKGAMGGMGGVIGATVGIALLLWVLSFFGQVPLIGEFVQKVEYTIESNH